MNFCDGMDSANFLPYYWLMGTTKPVRRITLKDIASRVGVSATAVSQALNGKGAMSDDLRERIKRVARELDYRPNPAARILRGVRSRSISLIINHFNNPFFRDFLIGLEQVTDAAGLSYTVSQTHDQLAKEEALARKMAEQGADGLIVLNCSARYAHLEEVSASFGIPVVLISHSLGDRFAAVQADNLRGGRLAAEHLLSLDDRPLFHIAGPGEKSGIADRKRGYLEVLAEKRPGISPDAICFPADELTASAGYRAMATVCETHHPPFGLFVVNDEVALGVLTYCRHHGLALPRDVALVGFSNIDLLETLDIPLTTISIPQHSMGVTAARVLLDLIDHPEARQCPPITTLPVSLIVRASTVGPDASRSFQPYLP